MRRIGGAVAAIAAFGFGYFIYLYLTLPDVRDLRTHNPETTAFIELRAREARAEGREAEARPSTGCPTPGFRRT